MQEGRPLEGVRVRVEVPGETTTPEAGDGRPGFPLMPLLREGASPGPGAVDPAKTGRESEATG